METTDNRYGLDNLIESGDWKLDARLSHLSTSEREIGARRVGGRWVEVYFNGKGFERDFYDNLKRDIDGLGYNLEDDNNLGSAGGGMTIFKRTRGERTAC